MVWELPETLEVNGIDYKIRTDFRAILDIINVFSDPNFEDDDKWIVCLTILYEDFENIPESDYTEAMEKARWFIDCGMDYKTNTKKPTLMDWEQDGSIILPAINKVLGYECRAQKQLHWWTFIGAYMEIGESLFSNILSIRSKKAKGQKLEKHEREFMRENQDIVILKTRLTEDEQSEEQAEQEALKKLLGG